MNELIFSTYIKIIQKAFLCSSGQEQIVNDLLTPFTKGGISSKDVSNLMRRKININEKYKAYCSDEKTIEKVKKHFKEKIMPLLNKQLLYDVLDEFINVINEDDKIGKLKKQEFINYYISGEYSDFLANIFLYALNRENKVNNANEVCLNGFSNRDMVLLEEVFFKCPISKRELIGNYNNKSIPQYEIVQIFPEFLQNKLIKELEEIHPKTADFNSLENLIALSTEEANKYKVGFSKERFIELYNLKKEYSTSYKNKMIINQFNLEDSIYTVLDSLQTIVSVEKLKKLKYKALKIDDKLETDFPQITKNEIRNDVVYYFKFIKAAFDENRDFNLIASEIKKASDEMMEKGIKKSIIFDKLVEWILCKTKLSSEYRRACEAVVSFFIQNCEVFSYEVSE